jgi:alpha-2-macroglobulin-like protein
MKRSFLLGRGRMSGVILTLLLSGSHAMTSCGGSDAPVSGGAAGSGPVPVGTPDVGSTGVLSIKEAEVRGTVEGGTLALRFRVNAVGAEAAKGSLNVGLRAVTGGNAISEAVVPYDLAVGDSQELTATLTLPGAVTQQAEWVKHNVRIEDGTKGGLRVTKSLLYVVSPYDVAIEGPSTVLKDKPASYRVRSRDPISKKPIGGVPVTLLVKRDGSDDISFSGTTRDTGDAVFELTLPDAGSYKVFARAELQGTTTESTSSFDVRLPASKVLLTTDKPIYQPGQIIHLRALALGTQGNVPLADRDAVFEVEDGKGNKILKRSGKTDSHGIVATDFRIGPVVNMGDFKVRAIVGDDKTEKTVSVSHYALPKFKIGVATDRAWYRAGDEVLITLDAGYFFGKPVAGGDVKVEAYTLDVGESVFQTVQGKTDASGKMTLSVKLPSVLAGLPLDGGNALVGLRVSIADTAKQEVKQEKLLTVSQSGVDLALVPESTVLVPGVENHVDLFASDPLGAPLPSMPVEIDVGGTVLSGTTDAWGHTVFAFTPAEVPEGTSVTVKATVHPPSAPAVSTDLVFGAQAGKEHVVVRSDKAVYETGETVQIQIDCSNPSSSVYVDWINAGQTVDMRTLQAENGVATFTMPLDTGLLGSNRIEAYVVDPDGNVIRSGRTVFARGHGALKIQMDTDKAEYAPGEPAQVTFSVADDSGQPAVAALGVQVVDEAVFALVDAKPGLLRTYFEIEEGFSKPAYEIHGPSADFSDLLFGATTDADQAKATAAQTRAGAAFAALGDKVPTGISASSWSGTTAEIVANLKSYVDVEKYKLGPVIAVAAKQAVADLQAEGCTPQMYYCQKLQKDFVTALSAKIGNSLAVYDFWGNAYATNTNGWQPQLTLTSAGPDEKRGTADDVAMSFEYADVGLKGVSVPGPLAGGEAEGDFDNGAGTGAGGSASGPGGGPDETPGAPRVRKDFPETLYVNPSIITGADGKATITVPMADSITTWRVSTLANAANGKLGGSVAGIRVFQDFFADIDFPASLTRGDEVTFPVAVYNYLPTPQTVKLELSPGDWYTALGPTSISVDLGPGEVKGVEVPVRVEKVGVNTLTVKAQGSQKADAVARMVRVIPDGKEIAESRSGALGTGELTEIATFPAGAVEGSPHLHLDVYPAFLSQVVSGMDSILQTPSGCFEQTTSTTWPNVLVTRYMKQTNQITPAIQMKAESLISAGYQRLLTFEHPGGGFSWFGTQDPAPFLSVTAFGVMEFADMAKVYEVDPGMITRTAQWLASQQKADGSWEGDQSEFFSFHTSVVRNTAFVAWSLASAGSSPSSVESGLAYVKGNMEDEPDTYTLAMAANAFVAAGSTDPFATELLTRLDQKKTEDGDKIHWSAEGTQTNFYGSGNDADVTSTALATHALLSAGGYASTVNGALAYLVGSKDAQGNFGSTQATIWTLRTLLLAATKGTEGAVGSLDVSVDGAPFTTVQLAADQSDVMHTVDLSSLATLGSHDVRLSFVGTGKVSYNLISRHNIPWAEVQEPAGPLSIGVSYDRTALAVNETVTATVTVTNNTATTENMVMVTLGIPPGFAPLTEDFDAYLQSNVLSKVESTGKQLDLYVSKLAPSAQQIFQYRLRATMPVKAEDGGASAYPYYEPDAKSSAASTTFQVVAAM